MNFERYLQMGLACVQREYPNQIAHVMTSDADARTPRALHPAFYGSFDWHSSVHTHWMLARLRSRFGIGAAEIDRIFDAHLTEANIDVELAYFRARPAFERPYGWAWLLALATELRGSRWEFALQPLADEIIERALAYFPKQAYPIRAGTHANTAFALGLMLDHAQSVGHGALEALVTERALTYFGHDADYPAHLEPSGADFLSPALVEADLMRRIAPRGWLDTFFPRGLPPQLAKPVRVTDRSDGQLAHLDGLNLSRAWCLRALGYEDAALAHLAAAQIDTGDYAGEHWLATFAVYLHTRTATQG